MPMKEISIRQVDAFTTHPYGGNYAGVVPDASGLTDAQMQSIAREMNVSETAFILPPSRAGADVRIRWFTPGDEVPLCGHATIASFHLLAEEGMRGMKREGRYSFRVETRSGILDVNVDKGPEGPLVEFELPVPTFRRMPGPPLDVLAALGLNGSHLHKDLPIVSENYLYLPVRSLSALREIRPAYAMLADACAAHDVLGVSVFTLETLEPTSAVHSRFFAPGLGVNEDPVTGSANGPLGAYLFQEVIPRGTEVPRTTLPDGRTEFVESRGMRSTGRDVYASDFSPRAWRSGVYGSRGARSLFCGVRSSLDRRVSHKERKEHKVKRRNSLHLCAQHFPTLCISV